LQSPLLGRSPHGVSARAARSRESVMTIADASHYLPHMGLDPLQVVGCAGLKCHNAFALASGFAVEAIVEGKVSIVFFCSAGCYLNDVPVDCCARA
jgi:hypothetical protein